jgi:hypothetical protein
VYVYSFRASASKDVSRVIVGCLKVVPMGNASISFQRKGNSFPWGWRQLENLLTFKLSKADRPRVLKIEECIFKYFEFSVLIFDIFRYFLNLEDADACLPLLFL